MMNSPKLEVSCSGTRTTARRRNIASSASAF